MKWFFIFYGLSFGFCQSSGADDWAKDALRLSGESTFVYQRSIQRLKANPTLDLELRQALKENTTQTYLALDVISALKRDSLFLDLVEAAQQDQSGFFFIALNTFFNSTHYSFLLNFYLTVLRDGHTTPAVKCVVLDTLGRIHYRLPLSELKKFLQQVDPPGLRSSALYYLRAFLKIHDPEYTAFFREFYHTRPAKSGEAGFTAQMEALYSENFERGDRP